MYLNGEMRSLRKHARLAAFAAWCVLLTLLLAQAGDATASVSGCVGECPCEAVLAEDHHEDHDGDEGCPGEDAPCPPDCGGCDCCPGVVLCIVGGQPAMSWLSPGGTSPPVYEDYLAAGELVQVFRPPKPSLI